MSIAYPWKPMSDIRRALQQFATEKDEQKRLEIADLLASQFEVRENSQNNRVQVTLWDAQMSTDKKLDSLHAQIADSNTLLTTFLDMYPKKVDQTLGEVKDGIAALHAGFSQVGEKVDQLAITQAEHATRLDTHEERLATVEMRLSATEQRMSAVEIEQASLRREYQHLVNRFERDKKLLRDINKESGGVE